MTKHETCDHHDFRRRIERLYQTAAGTPHTRGAQAWWSRRTGWSPRSIQDWCGGRRSIRDAVWRQLEAAEREHGLGEDA